jgi:TrmH family RNA methyltransferase
MGAHFYFDDIIIDTDKSIINFLTIENFNTYCADLNGKDIAVVNSNQKWAVILGSEAHGISKSFQSYDKITIKKWGEIESLNVSVACGIILDRFKNNNY